MTTRTTRRTQAERRAASREALLDAAARVIATRGYEAAPVDEIAAAAGVSKGAVYWHFEGKEDLFLALLEERLDSRVQALAALTRDAPVEQSTAGSLSGGLHALLTGDRELVLLALEQATVATRDAKVRQRHVKRMRRLRRAVTTAVSALHRRNNVPLPLPAEDLAKGYLALAQGLVLTEATEPGSVPEGLYGRMLELVYAGAQAEAERRGT